MYGKIDSFRIKFLIPEVYKKILLSRKRKPMISVCIIAKNEEKTIEKCLKALRPYPFEIVLVDTGSEDKTKELASRYTEHIYDFPWTGDFSEAKNYAVSKASNDWILSIDCDECLEPFDYKYLLRQLRDNPEALGTILIKNISSADAGTVFPNVRIFNRKYYRFQYRVHEQPRRIDPSLPYYAFDSRLSVLHSGYDLNAQDARKKYTRNISLLKQALTECPEEDKAYFYYQLAQSYAALSYHGEIPDTDSDLDSAYINYENAIRCGVPPTAPYYKLLVIQYGTILMKKGEYEKALTFLDSRSRYLNTFADYNVLLAQLYMYTQSFEKSIPLLEKALTLKDCFSEGSNSYTCYYYLALAHKQLQHYEAAAEYYEKCLPFSASSGLAPAFLYYNVGQCYYITGNYEKSIHFFDKGLSYDVEPTDDYVQDMVISYGYSLINSGRISDALCLEGIYDAFSFSGDYLFLLGLIYMKNALFLESVKEFGKAAEHFHSLREQDKENEAYYNTGVIYECMKDFRNAAFYYKKCSSYPPAVERLKVLDFT